jgi:hypothetical protein
VEPGAGLVMSTTPDAGELETGGGGAGAGGVGEILGVPEATTYGTTDLSRTFPVLVTAKIVSVWKPFGITGAMFTLFEKTSPSLCPLSQSSRWNGFPSIAEAEIGTDPYTVAFARGLVMITPAKADVKQGTRAKENSAAIRLFIGEGYLSGGRLLACDSGVNK